MKRINNLASLLLITLLAACTEEYQQDAFPTPNPTTQWAKTIIDNSNNFVASLHRDSTYQLVPGLNVLEMDFINERGLRTQLFMFEVDLTTPGLTILATSPDDKMAFGMQKMTLQAKAIDKPSSTVWGAVNGDFFNTSTGVPRGAFYQRGNAIKTAFESEHHTLFAMFKDGSPHILTQLEYAQVKGNIQEAVGGRVVLLRRGELLYQESDPVEPRTCVGITADNKVYFLCVDGRYFTYSNGMKYTEMARILKTLDCTDAINLDGGGSTTFITRNAADVTDNRFVIQNHPYDGGGIERSVANGLVIVTNNQ